MDLEQRWLPNEAQNAGTVLDGEALIINLTTGLYYSMDKVGGILWEEIMRGASIAEIIDSITERYDVSAVIVQHDLESLWADLAREELVIAADSMRAPRPDRISGEKMTYDPPHLVVYRDMNDLLALDPPMPGLEDIPWKNSSD